MTVNQDIINGNTYTRQNVADMLHVTVITVDNYIKAKKLQAVKVANGKVLITETALNKFLNENTKGK